MTQGNGDSSAKIYRARSYLNGGDFFPVRGFHPEEMLDAEVA